MSAAIARRDDGCASDLLMDRWLLGEIPGSDEGRRLEQHVRGCTGCAARFQALRSLYGNRPMPKAEAPLPPLSKPPPAVLPPEHAAVLQVVILRDGLLVGTEVFTAGRYTVGSDHGCALKLDDVASVHAALSLRGERVGLEAAGGQVFVNGFRATSCELRPIDEVAVGPYVLRARVIAERWHRPKLSVVGESQPAPAEKKPAPVALKLSLYWGDALLEVRVLDAPADLKDFGITSVEAIDGGWQLDGLRVAHGELQRFHYGQLVCVAECVTRSEAVARRPLRHGPWAVVLLSAVLYAGVLALGHYGAGLDPPDFVPKPIPPAIVHMVAPRPKLPPKQPPPALSTGCGHKHVVPSTRPPPVISDRRDWWRSKQPVIPAGTMDAINKALDKLNAPGKRGTGVRVASLGPAAAGTADLGFHSDKLGSGIGAKGFKGVAAMNTRNFGTAKVNGSVGTAQSRQVNAPIEVDRDAIARVINAHLHEVSRCYEQSMLHGGAFSGRMLLEWTINPNGRVSAASVKNGDITNAEFPGCVLAHLKTWGFPKVRADATVTYPIVVRSVGY